MEHGGSQPAGGQTGAAPPCPTDRAPATARPADRASGCAGRPLPPTAPERRAEGLSGLVLETKKELSLPLWEGVGGRGCCQYRTAPSPKPPPTRGGRASHCGPQPAAPPMPAKIR